MKPDQILASLSQLDHQKRPVTRVAIVFFTLACLSLGGMQAWSVYRARAVQLKQTQIATANLTQTVAEHTANTLTQADSLLLEMVERVGSESDQLRLQRYMGERVARGAILSDLAVYDADGVRTLGASASLGAPPDAAAQLRIQKFDPVSRLHISAPVRRPGSDEWVLPLSRRLITRDGAFGGMVLAHLRIKVLQSIYNDLTFDNSGTLMLALNSGQLVLAKPDKGTRTGMDLRANTAFQLARKGETGSQFRSTGSLGHEVEHLYSYRGVKAYPLVVVMSMPSDAILSDWWDSAYLSTAGVSLLMLIQLWLGIRLYGQVALRDRLEKERRSLQKLLVKKSRSLRRQALKDALTGIANRRQFDTRLLREFNRAATDGRPLSLVILDVDYFKKYNDQHGHPAGDECLKSVAGCINNGRRRSQDLAARMGGEEFAILLPDTDLRGAIAVAESIRKTVAARTMDHISGKPHSVTVSCGVHSVVPTLNMAPSDLVDAADRALYLAKTSGRNRVRAEGSMPPGSSKRFSLVVNK
ncbi:GGDEF domain-containing protein [Massilia sp. CF038]|uniref:GGDEF domain-containing protein n=1 Tax=Massilia sp. CF038 TaxID=1881045 RepID=UPI0009201E20|nr:GGDEF domain-containing protein [Massilia sp. CF038]SHG65319.1 diguanylate cyclase (GGDEF) domain-containing protein [Massilia sp. CF038]